MARDARQSFTWTQDTAATMATGGLRVVAPVNTAGTAYTGVLVYANTAGSNYFFNRAASNALNRSGFRNTLADNTNFVTGAVQSAIPLDPAIVGNTQQGESYIRLTYAMLGPAFNANVTWSIVAEAASDSGTGTAGSDWTVVSNSIAVASPAARALSNITLAAGATALTLASHGLSVGDMIQFTVLTGGTGLTVNVPYYVVAVPSTSTFNISTTPNGTALSNTGSNYTTMTGFASPSIRRIAGLLVAPTAKPWIRVAVHSQSTGATAIASGNGVWIQDAFFTVGRDSASVA